MCAIQEISARIGRVTGPGASPATSSRHYPTPLLYTLHRRLLLITANVINIGADLGAMAAALKLVIGGGSGKWLYRSGFRSSRLRYHCSLSMEVFIRYARYVSILKVADTRRCSPMSASRLRGPHALGPRSPITSLFRRSRSFKTDYLTVVVAILGTTISPYLFFWQAEEEVEEVKERPFAKPLVRAPDQAPAEFSRIRWDTYIGMAFSNAVALFIVLTTAATLHAHGATDIQTSSQAAFALKPIAGPFTFVIFALGIIGTGLLALPVLAGSAAYAVGEAFGWHAGLARKWYRARRFNAALAMAFLLGAILNFVHLDPIKALFWSAVINGVVAVPLMILIMHMAGRKVVMGDFKLNVGLKTIGWVATAVMAAAAVGMFATMRA